MSNKTNKEREHIDFNWDDGEFLNQIESVEYFSYGSRLGTIRDNQITYATDSIISKGNEKFTKEYIKDHLNEMIEDLIRVYFLNKKDDHLGELSGKYTIYLDLTMIVFNLKGNKTTYLTPDMLFGYQQLENFLNDKFGWQISFSNPNEPQNFAYINDIEFDKNGKVIKDGKLKFVETTDEWQKFLKNRKKSVSK